MARKPASLPPGVESQMKGLGLSIEGLAEKVGVASTTLGHQLRGTNDMPLAIALSLVKALQIKDPKEKVAIFEDIVKHRQSRQEAVIN